MKLLTYREGQMLPPHHFFILNKGNNSGKPLDQPCPNCFLCEAETDDEKEKLYWITCAIWATGRYRQYLTGSVIPFLRIDDVKQCLELGEVAVRNMGAVAFSQAITMLDTLHKLNQHHDVKLQLIKRLRLEILRHFAVI